MSEGSRSLYETLLDISKDGEMAVPEYRVGKLENMEIEDYTVVTDSGKISAKYTIDPTLSVGSKVLVVTLKDLSVILGVV